MADGEKRKPVTGYYDVASLRLIHSSGLEANSESGFKNGNRPTMTILNGMGLQAQVCLMTARFWPGDQNKDPRYPDLSPYYDLQPVSEFGPSDEHKLRSLITEFAQYVIPSELLELDSDSVDYINNNLGRVLDYLVPKVRNGHLRVYSIYSKRTKKEKETRARVFLDLEDPEKPYFLHLVFGLRAQELFTSEFFPWKPTHDETCQLIP